MNTFDSLKTALLWLESSLPSSSRIQRSKAEKLLMIKTLLQLCNNPQQGLRIIHITGSKGKSTMARTADVILREHGQKSGLFMSPHVNVYNERICIDGQMISDEEFLRTLEYVHARVCDYKQQKADFAPTVFETLTAAAFCAFRNAQCQWAVVEVGIGGRYDTTNVVEPELCIIGEIEYEHTDLLGRTIGEIAQDKAGIIKKSVPVWVAPQLHEEVLCILKETAQKQQSMLYYMPEHCSIENVVIESTGTRADLTFNFGDAQHKCTYKTATLGKALLDDQVLVHAALSHYILGLGEQNVEGRASTHVRMGEEIALPARCELIQSSPSFFIDGAHTQQSMKNSCACVQALFPRACLVLGMLKNKNHRAACELIREHDDFFSHVIITSCGENFNSAHEQLYEMIVRHFQAAQLCTDVTEALQRAIELCTASVGTAQGAQKLVTPVISVMGSFYLCSVARSLCLKYTGLALQ